MDSEVLAYLASEETRVVILVWEGAARMAVRMGLLDQVLVDQESTAPSDHQLV